MRILVMRAPVMVLKDQREKPEAARNSNQNRASYDGLLASQPCS